MSYIYILNKNIMHTVLWKLFRYVLWLILIAIVLLLFVGLAKNNRNVKWYVQALNQKSRSEAWQQGGISGIFWGTTPLLENEEMETGTWEILITGDAELATGVDVYDPNFEQDLNQMPQDTLSSGDYGDVQTDFGFTTDGSGSTPSQATVTTTSGSKSQQLLDLVKQREMTTTWK